MTGDLCDWDDWWTTESEDDMERSEVMGLRERIGKCAAMGIFCHLSADDVVALDALLAAAPSPEPREPDWQPIATAPWERHGKPVLLYRNGEFFTAMRLRGEHGPGWCTPDGYEILRPTHWMPLPKPPIAAPPQPAPTEGVDNG